MKLAAYVSLFELLSVLTWECRAQVNVFDVAGGGGTDIAGLSSSNEGSQVANTINNSGSNAPNLRRAHARNRPYRPNGTFGPNRNFDPNGFSDTSGSLDPNSYFDPNRSYDPNSSFDPNISYDPNSSFGVNGNGGLQGNFGPNENQATGMLIPYTVWRPELGYYYYQYRNPHLQLQGQYEK